MKLNLPTKLTVLRLLLIPFCMAAIIAPVFPGDVIWRIVAVAIFALTSITDMLDGMIARKYNLVTTLGKFFDPLADKMLIIGVLISVMLRYSEDKTFCTVLGIALRYRSARNVGHAAAHDGCEQGWDRYRRRVARQMQDGNSDGSGHCDARRACFVYLAVYAPCAVVYSYRGNDVHDRVVGNQLL